MALFSTHFLVFLFLMARVQKPYKPNPCIVAASLNTNFNLFFEYNTPSLKVQMDHRQSCSVVSSNWNTFWVLIITIFSQGVLYRYHSWAAIVTQLKKSGSEINGFEVSPCNESKESNSGTSAIYLLVKYLTTRYTA